MTGTKTGKKLEGLTQVATALESLGYELQLHEDSIFVKVGGSKDPFTAVMLISEKNELVITCQLARFGDFTDDRIPNVVLAALDANTKIRPFAYGVITDADDPELQKEEKWAFVLTNSVPMGDLSEGELEAAMESLLRAIMDSRHVLETGLSGQ